MEFNTLKYIKSGARVTISLDRPKVYNALNKQLLQELKEALDSAEKDPDIRVILLSGEGMGFCSGQDLTGIKDYGNLTPSEIIDRFFTPVILGIVNNAKPIICKLNGKAAGAGMALVLACDMIIAGESSSMVSGFGQVGLMPDSGISYFLLNIVGPKKALEILALGNKISATEASDLNLINHVVPDDKLNDFINSIADNLSGQSGNILKMLKKVIKNGNGESLESILKLEGEMQNIAVSSPDFKEGIAAFIEKRKPVFKALK